jgi:hypothetical protein
MPGQPSESKLPPTSQGTIQDAKTIVGLLLWDRLRHEVTD